VVEHVEAHPHVALRRQVIDLVRLHVAQQVDQADAVDEVGVVQEQRAVGALRVLVDAVDPAGVETGGTAHGAVHHVALAEQQFGEVAAVLGR